MPSVVLAQTQALNLMDTFEKANITPSIEDYEESDDQVQIYLFWSSSCTHCHDLLDFLNDILEEYKDKFKMRSYEVSTNADNSELHEEVVDYFKLGKYGVPLLVVGESTFYGFSESTESKILEAIDSEYARTDRYDVFEKMGEKDANKNPNDALYIIIPVLGIVVIGVLISFAKKEN